MVEAGPAGDARVVKFIFSYSVSDEWIEARMDLEGVEMPKLWSISFELSDLPNPGERHRARKLWHLYEQFGGEAELEEPCDDPVEFLDRLEEWIAAERERIDYEDHQREEAEHQRELAAREFSRAMQRWIEANGTNRLKAACARGYKVTGSYARARVREEIPGAWVDTSGRALYRERVDPSSEALELEDAFETFAKFQDLELRTRIVWLVEPPTGLAELYEDLDFDEEAFSGGGWEFERQEAILISGYLGRYEAFLMVDHSARAPLDEEGD
jgi:hypothetical protein